MQSYGNLSTRFYNADKPDAPPKPLAFIKAIATELNGPIWEPMCGSGRFLIPLRKDGFDIDGSDASPEMLQSCRSRLGHLGIRSEVLEQKLHESAMPRKYNLAFILSGSFGLINDQNDAQESLRRIYDHLTPGGKFVVEVSRVSLHESNSWPWGGRWVDIDANRRILCSWLGSYDAETRISKSVLKYELFVNGVLNSTELDDFNLKYYEDEEFVAMLNEAGFQVEQTLNDECDGESEEDDCDVVFVCNKATTK
ncbi:MAG: class I SAM-dependent methyltransferase [bacterium]